MLLGQLISVESAHEWTQTYRLVSCALYNRMAPRLTLFELMYHQEGDERTHANVGHEEK